MCAFTLSLPLSFSLLMKKNPKPSRLPRLRATAIRCSLAFPVVTFKQQEAPIYKENSSSFRATVMLFTELFTETKELDLR